MREIKDAARGRSKIGKIKRWKLIDPQHNPAVSNICPLWQEQWHKNIIIFVEGTNTNLVKIGNVRSEGSNKTGRFSVGVGPDKHKASFYSFLDKNY